MFKSLSTSLICARHPRRRSRDHRAGLAPGHGARPGHPVRRVRVHRGRPGGRAGVQQPQGRAGVRAPAPRAGGPRRRSGRPGLARADRPRAWCSIVGTWAVIAGVVEIAAAFAEGEPAGTRALFILGGLVSIAFGVVLFARPGVGAITLALLFGLYNLAYGAWALVQGIELRRTGRPSTPPSRKRRRRRPDPMARPPQAAAAKQPQAACAVRCRIYGAAVRHPVGRAAGPGPRAIRARRHRRACTSRPSRRQPGSII